MAAFAVFKPGRNRCAVVALSERDNDRTGLFNEAGQAAAHVAIESRREDKRRLDECWCANANERGGPNLGLQCFMPRFL